MEEALKTPREASDSGDITMQGQADEMVSDGVTEVEQNHFLANNLGSTDEKALVKSQEPMQDALFDGIFNKVHIFEDENQALEQKKEQKIHQSSLHEKKPAEEFKHHETSQKLLMKMAQRKNLPQFRLATQQREQLKNSPIIKQFDFKLKSGVLQLNQSNPD